MPWITPGYFATLRQPLLAGREFTAADAQGQPKVAVVNWPSPSDSTARRKTRWAARWLKGAATTCKLDTTIVGVVGDIKHQDLRTDMGPAVYRPYLQQKHPGGVRSMCAPRSRRRASKPPSARRCINSTPRWWWMDCAPWMSR